MSNVAIIYSDFIAGSTVGLAGGGAAQSGYPLTNITDGRLFTQFRNTAADYDYSITVDFGSNQSISGIYMFGLNLQPGLNPPDIRIRFDSTTPPGGSPTYDTGNLSISNATYNPIGGWEPRSGKPWSYLTNFPKSASNEAAALTWTERYLQIDFDNDTNPPSEGYLRLSILGAGRVWYPDCGYQRYRPIDSVVKNGLVLRRYEMSFDNLTPTEHHEITNVFRAKGGIGRVVLNPKPYDEVAEIHEMLLCTIQELNVTPVPGTGGSGRRFEVSMVFEEAGF